MNPRQLWLVGFFTTLMVVNGSAREPWPTKRWPTSAPRAVGLDSKALADLDQDLVNGEYGHVDSMLIIRHGKLVCDRSYKHDYDQIYGPESDKPGPLNAHDPSGPYNYLNPWWHPYYRRGDLHTLQSVTKTITSIIIGIATTRKEFPALDTPILNYFDVSTVANVDDRKRHMTIRHLMAVPVR